MLPVFVCVCAVMPCCFIQYPACSYVSLLLVLLLHIPVRTLCRVLDLQRCSVILSPERCFSFSHFSHAAFTACSYFVL